jgi:outer membrane lipoprotein-sorting protein
MRPLCFALLLFTSASVFGQNAPLTPAEIHDLLGRIRQVRAKAPNVQAQFQEEKTIRLLTKPVMTSGRIWFQAPNKFRRELIGKSPSVTMSNGRNLWIYYPNFKSAEHYSLGQRSPVDAAITAVNAALNLENAGSSFSISGRRIDNGYELELRPRAAAMKRIFEKFVLHLNRDLFAERTEMLQPYDERVVTTYSNYSRAPIPAATFEFSAPPGTEITAPLGR